MMWVLGLGGVLRKRTHSLGIVEKLLWDFVEIFIYWFDDDINGTGGTWGWGWGGGSLPLRNDLLWKLFPRQQKLICWLILHVIYFRLFPLLLLNIRAPPRLLITTIPSRRLQISHNFFHINHTNLYYSGSRKDHKYFNGSKSIFLPFQNKGFLTFYHIY